MVEALQPKAPASPASRSVLTFRLERVILALPVECALQIIPMVTFLAVPQLAHVVAGVINLHGAAVPVVDLRRHLGLPATPFGRYTPIILARAGGRTVGLIVDEVMDVVDVPAGEIACPADVLPADLATAPVLQGFARVPAGLLVLLDPEHLFRPDQAEALAQAAEFLERVPSATGGTRPA